MSLSIAAQEFEASAFAPGDGVGVPGRISARAAFQELLRGGVVLADVRSELARRRHGSPHPILLPRVIDRHLLEWRLDPRSETALPEASYDARVVLLSGRGDSSQQLAEELRALGVRNAVDVIGGFEAWLAAGLPSSM
ncbi:rhodanese-like domain-containing protein [Nocardioides sp. Bht2]|uniref:rhodanese-like domain-containing protein n=1 Tax=Nocardioides sp. Bht2 TaxID=3392297 RepID=UPI0039B3FE22